MAVSPAGVGAGQLDRGADRVRPRRVPAAGAGAGHRLEAEVRVESDAVAAEKASVGACEVIRHTLRGGQGHLMHARARIAS